MTTHAFAPRFDLSNVFMPARDTFADAAEASAADSTEQCWALAKNGPPVSADEVESHVDAVEVTVRWGTQVLSVAHLGSGKSFYVGDDSDVALPEELLGAARAAIVQARVGATYVVVPPSGRAVVTMRGDQSHAQGASEIMLAHGMTVSVEIGPVTIEIGTVRAGKVAPVGFLAALAGGATGFVGLSFIGHAAIVASLAMFMPKMSTDDTDAMDRDQMMLMQKFLSASAEREQDQVKDLTAASTEPTGGGSTGQPHQGESGAAGTTKPVTTNGHMGFKGSDPAPALSPKQERELAANFGMIGLLATSAPVDPNAPASPWAKEFQGNDDKSAMGKMFGTSIEDANGYGLGLFGTGEGGGGKGEGVGVDKIGTIGGGGGGPGKWGIGRGDKDGIGNGTSPGTGGHIAKAPPAPREGKLVTNGRIPAEVIQRIVRQNFGRFRLCYEAGLRGNPSLTGRVSTKFVIGRDGAVMQASDAGSDMPDQNVVACVVRSFNALSFPSPEGGVATVTYPIILTPGE